MDNMGERKRLTKAEILNGKDYVEHVYIKALDGEIAIRPLTDGEYSIIDTMKLGGMKIKGKAPEEKGQKFKADDMELDLERLQRQDFEADCRTVTWGMSVQGEKYTEIEVKRFPQGAISEISKQIYRLTGVRPKGVEEFKIHNEEGDLDPVQSFREEL